MRYGRAIPVAAAPENIRATAVSACRFRGLTQSVFPIQCSTFPEQQELLETDRCPFRHKAARDMQANGRRIAVMGRRNGRMGN
jgi:hypothetical protein